MNASILVLLVAVAAVGVHAEKIIYKECDEDASFPGLLDRVQPKNYDLTLDIASNSSDLEQVVKIQFLVDDSKSRQEEPKNLIVLNAGNNITLGLVAVVIPADWSQVDTPVKLASVCRDSERQLLVIRTERDIENGDKLAVVVVANSPIRTDDKAVYKRDQVYMTDFTNSQGHLSIPCFDDLKYTTPLRVKLVYSTDLIALSSTLVAHNWGHYSNQLFVEFVSEEPVGLPQISFSLRPVVS